MDEGLQVGREVVGLETVVGLDGVEFGVGGSGADGADDVEALLEGIDDEAGPAGDGLDAGQAPHGGGPQGPDRPARLVPAGTVGVEPLVGGDARISLRMRPRRRGGRGRERQPLKITPLGPLGLCTADDGALVYLGGGRTDGPIASLSVRSLLPVTSSSSAA